jgi:hypothetical protein
MSEELDGELEYGVDAENTASFSAPVSDSVPRYLSHTLSSSSVNSAAAETERITRSFRSGNFYSIKKLPTKFAPGGVEDARKKNIAKTLSDKPISTYKAKVTASYFTPFTYCRTEYNKLKENEREEAQYQRLTTLSFSRKPFTYASSKVRLKNEDLFGDEEYKFPVLGPGRGKMELSHFIREDFADSSKMIHGPFSVVGPRRGEKEVSRDEVALWSREIFDKLSEDWGHLRFTIKFTGSDELVVSFDAAMLPPGPDGEGFEDRALSKYMSTMARHGVAAERRLKKRGDRWRVVEWEDVCEPCVDSVQDERTPGKESSQPIFKKLLVFSFYAPWCVSSHVSAHKVAAKTERMRTRRTVRTQRDTLRMDRVGMAGDDMEGLMAMPDAPSSSRQSFANTHSSLGSQSIPTLLLPLSARHRAQSTESGRSASGMGDYDGTGRS